ncbi:MAG TPA: hypothetical protein VMW08_04400 [Acidimicrobiales bacterium]|nr:hypothetical protein [Acidimicrobiales bacterium]
MSDDPNGASLSASTSIDLDALSTPGLHEVEVENPVEAARQLADDLGGELVGSDDLATVIERRASRHGASARQLLERRVDARPEDRVRVVVDIDQLRAIASGLVKADRILSGTEANMVEVVGQHVTGGGISVHPDSIRGAAAEVSEARKAVAGLHLELDKLNEQMMDSLISVGAEERASALEPEVEVEDDRVTGKMARATKRRIAGVLLMAFGIAIVLGAVLATTVSGPVAVVVLVLPIVACWWAFRTARFDISDLDDKDTASDNLAQISARTDAVFGGSPVENENGSGGIPASTGAQLQQVESQLALARERERSASANWTELAGGEADPADVERVLRERDPQYFGAIDLVSQTSQARAAAAHLRRVKARWNVAWAVLGDEPPTAADAEKAVRELASAGLRAVKINTRIGSDTDRALALRTLDAYAPEEPAEPMVLADVPDTLSDEVIDSLAALANSTPIVVVSAPTA